MKSVFRFSVACAAVFAAGGWAPADTITLKNGISIDGKITARSDGQIRVQLGDQEVVVPVADVESTEANDKAAPVIDYDALERAAKERDKELVEKTGLQARQRAEVDELLQMFFLSDEATTQSAKRTLLDMAKTDSSPYRYLGTRLPDINPAKIAPLLEVMFDMNPEGMRETLKQYAVSASETARAACLHCLAKLKDKSSLELIKRGLVDEDPDVRIAAVRGVEALRVREATPVLLKTLTTSDMRVQNASRDALSTLWTEPGQPPLNFLQNSGWADFWKTKSASVPGAWVPGTIEPLVPPGTVVQMD